MWVPLQPLSFEFYGVRCDIFVPTQVDADHLLYYFHYFRASQGNPVIEISLEVEDTQAPFMESLLNSHLTKRISVRQSTKTWLLYDRFQAKSNRPTPIPPFEFAPLRDTIRLLHAASIVSPTGGSLILTGGSFSGKSVLVLEMLRRGWRFQSDDL